MRAFLWLFCGVCLAADPVPESLSSPNQRYRVYEQEVAGQIQLWLHDTAKSQTRALVTLPGRNQFAAWSPDSLFIAFCATFNAQYFITVSDLTGHSWMVAEINGGCSQPVWSRDAVWLAFSAQTRFGDRDIFQATAGGTDHSNLTNSRDRSETFVAWSVEEQRFIVE